MHRKLFTLVFVLSTVLPVAAQNGQSGFQILQTVSPARVAALGGNQNAVKDGDLNLGLLAPSLLDSTTTDQITFGYTRFFGEANLSHAGYAKHFNRIGTFSFGLTALGYGDFEWTDESGQSLGSFNAGEYLFQVGYGGQLDDRFSLGGNLKFVYSELEEYKASAAALDLSGTYYHPEKQFTATVLIKNVGTTLSDYRDGVSEDLPFEIQAGISKRLSKAPLRFSIIAENLQKWDLVPEESTTEIDPLTGEEVVTNPGGFGENLMRHLVFNAEVILTENIYARIGYNYNRRKQLFVEQNPGGAGLTFGVGVRIAKIHLSYAHAKFNPAGVNNHFTLTVKFDDFRKG